MGFKDDCISHWKAVVENKKKEETRRNQERYQKQKKEIFSNFKRIFDVELTEDHLIEDKKEYGTFFKILIEGIKISVDFNSSSYYPNFSLMVPCYKCGKETPYKTPIRSRYEIGNLLLNLEETPEYNRICSICKTKEYEENRERRDRDYENQLEERKKNTIRKLADAIADILYEGGYPELRNHELEDY